MSRIFHYDGFSSPNGTIVPDDVFDVLMPELSGAELRVLLYIIRRTFGFKKESDNISLKQMVEGIKTKDGRVLDHGSGLAKGTAAIAIKGLVEKGIVEAQRNRSREKGDEPTTYRLRFLTQQTREPVSENQTRGGMKIGQGGVRKSDTQQTVVQQTVLQYSNRNENALKQAVAISQPDKLKQRRSHQKGKFEPLSAALSTFQQTTLMPKHPDDDRAVLDTLLTPYRSEFGDRAGSRASTSRILNLFSKNGVTKEAFANLLAEAASRTRESLRLGTIDGRAFAYYVSVLEHLLQPI
jgi:Bacteriophage replication protein O